MSKIDEIIDKHLEREEKKRKVGVYFCSEIPYCMRRTWYSYKVNRPYPPETKRVFERGNVYHEWLAKIFSKSTIVKSTEAEARLIIPDPQTGIVIRGRVDDFITIEDGGKRYVCEIKTTADISYTTAVSKHHLYQITPYLLIDYDDEGKPLPGKVIYIDSRNLSIKEFNVEFDLKILQKILQRARKLHNHLLENSLPEAESKGINEDKWLCRYCLYADLCGKNVGSEEK